MSGQQAVRLLHRCVRSQAMRLQELHEVKDSLAPLRYFYTLS
jgi:hypothetical protein